MRTLFVCLFAIGIFACAKPVFNYNTHINSVVKITENTMGSHGTGFYIGDNLIVTAKHVVKLNVPYYYVDRDDNTLHNIEIVYTSETLDIAILRTRHQHNLQPVVFAQDDVQIGDFIHSMGFPLILEWVYSCGYVSGVDITFAREQAAIVFAGNYFSTNMPIDRGMSGGPVFNKQGELVGMLNAMLTSGSFAWGMSLSSIQKTITEYKGR